MNKSVWVVDDDESILDVIQIVLQQEGLEAYIVGDPATLETQLATHNLPAVILLDVLMSGIDGRDLTKKIKNNNKTSRIPIILMTANNNIEDIAEKAGADDFLRKPFNIDELVNKVKSHLK